MFYYNTIFYAKLNFLKIYIKDLFVWNSLDKKILNFKLFRINLFGIDIKNLF